MDLPLLSAAAVGAAALTFGDLPGPATPAVSLDEAAALVGLGLYASEDPIDRWGGPVRVDDATLDRLGRVAEVVTAPDGTALGLVVAIGGLWGLGAREVEVGLERVHLLSGEGGATRLVVDLSVEDPLPG